MHNSQPCKAKTKRGRPCRLPVGRGGYCAIHRPGRNPWHPWVHPQTVGQRNYHERRAAAAENRRTTIAAFFGAGAPRKEIAEIMGLSVLAVNAHLVRLRKEGRVANRCEPIDLTDRQAREIKGLWGAGQSAAEIGTRFGWSELRARSAISLLRRRGYDLPQRLSAKAELAALERAQRIEDRSGSRSLRDPQHWTAPSLDAALTDDGSLTILDTLGAEDENFAELAA